jgi:hypothetical protein
LNYSLFYQLRARFAIHQKPTNMKKSLNVLIFLAIGIATILLGGADLKKTPAEVNQSALAAASEVSQFHGDSLKINSKEAPEKISEEKATVDEQKERPRKRNRGLLAIGVLLIVVALILWIR